MLHNARKLSDSSVDATSCLSGSNFFGGCWGSTPGLLHASKHSTSELCPQPVLVPSSGSIPGSGSARVAREHSGKTWSISSRYSRVRLEDPCPRHCSQNRPEGHMLAACSISMYVCMGVNAFMVVGQLGSYTEENIFPSFEATVELCKKSKRTLHRKFQICRSKLCRQ